MTNFTPPTALSRKFTLGEYRIDPGVNQIQGLDSITQVEPKAMAVLCALASRAGETMGREALMAAVWPGRVVVEETLTRAISQLRTALSDDASKPVYIQTVPKQGYRLIAPVDATGAAASGAAAPHPADSPDTPAETAATTLAPGLVSASQLNKPGGADALFTRQLLPLASKPLSKGLLGVVVLGLLTIVALYQTGHLTADRAGVAATPSLNYTPVAPAQPSVAVMPFRNLGSDSKSEYFAEGIAEELLNALAGVPGLRVPSRRSSFAFKGQDTGLDSIAAQLNVRHILEGSVRRSGETLRIQAQLIAVQSDTTVWSQQFDRQLEDIFAVQEEIALQVIAALRGTLLSGNPVPTRITRSANMDAYSVYLQGQYWWMNGTTSNWFYQARDAFERAIELDPEFADAYAGLAYIYARFNFYDEYMPAAQARPRAESAIRRALELDPTALDAYFARAILASTVGEYASARADLDRALQLSPNSSTAHFLYSEIWLAENQPQKAIAAATRALDLDPLSPWVNVNMAIVLFAVGQWDQAMTAVKRAMEIDPRYTWAHVWQAKIEHARGNLAQAIQAMHSSVEIDPASESSTAYLGLLYLEIQDMENAQTWLAHTASLHGDSSAARFWQGFAALASAQQTHSDTLVDLAQDMSLLATTTYDLVPILHAAQLSSGTPGNAIAWFSRRHPQLLSGAPPLVSIDNASTTVALIYLLREQGETARAQALLDAALTTAALFPSQFRWRGQDAELLALAGRKPEALAALEASFELGWRLNWWMLKLSPALATLRNEPRFNTVVEAAEMRAASQRVRVQEMQSRGDMYGD